MCPWWGGLNDPANTTFFVFSSEFCFSVAAKAHGYVIRTGRQRRWARKTNGPPIKADTTQNKKLFMSRKTIISLACPNAATRVMSKRHVRCLSPEQAAPHRIGCARCFQRSVNRWLLRLHRFIRSAVNSRYVSSITACIGISHKLNRHIRFGTI